MTEEAKISGEEFRTAWHDGALEFAQLLLKERYDDKSLYEVVYRPSAIVCFFAEREGEKRVLKVEPRHERDRTLTLWAIEQWRAAGALMPAVVEIGEDKEFEFEISEYADGKPFTDDMPWELKERAIHDMVTQLTLMHSIKTTGFGLLIGEGGGKHGTWHEDVAERSASRWQGDASCYSDTEQRILDEFVNELSDVDVDSVLLHGDYKLYNAFLDEDGHVQAIIDPNVMCGDPLWDVATWRHFVTRRAIRVSIGIGPKLDPDEFERERALFLESYEGERGAGLTKEECSRIALYELVSLAKKVPKLLARPYWKTEGEAVLSRVRKEIAQWR